MWSLSHFFALSFHGLNALLLGISSIRYSSSLLLSSAFHEVLGHGCDSAKSCALNNKGGLCSGSQHLDPQLLLCPHQNGLLLVTLSNNTLLYDHIGGSLRSSRFSLVLSSFEALSDRITLNAHGNNGFSQSPLQNRSYLSIH